MGMKSSDWSDRRHHCHWEAESDDAGFWVPDRSEIVTQFFTRYLFFSLAVIYFSTLESVRPVLFSIEQLLVALGVYFFINSWFFRQALQGVTLLKIRSAMSADLIIVTLCVIHDPNPIPPSALAFLMVLLATACAMACGCSPKCWAAHSSAWRSPLPSGIGWADSRSMRVTCSSACSWSPWPCMPTS